MNLVEATTQDPPSRRNNTAVETRARPRHTALQPSVRVVGNRIIIERLEASGNSSLDLALLVSEQQDATAGYYGLGRWRTSSKTAMSDPNWPDLRSRIQAARRLGPDSAPTIQAVTDAIAFLDALSPSYSTPKVTPTPGEIIFEWRGQNIYVTASVRGNGRVGYAIRTDGKTRPGAEKLSLPARNLPQDFASALAAILAGA